MIIKDTKGNELLEIITGEENDMEQRYSQITHCLLVVKIEDDYLMGWNKWRNNWEIFGGCREEGESIRECIEREITLLSVFRRCNHTFSLTAYFDTGSLSESEFISI